MSCESSSTSLAVNTSFVTPRLILFPSSFTILQLWGLMEVLSSDPASTFGSSWQIGGGLAAEPGVSGGVHSFQMGNITGDGASLQLS